MAVCCTQCLADSNYKTISKVHSIIFARWRQCDPYLMHDSLRQSTSTSQQPSQSFLLGSVMTKRQKYIQTDHSTPSVATGSASSRAVVQPRTANRRTVDECYLVWVEIDKPDVVGQHKTFLVHEKARRNADDERRRNHQQLKQSVTFADSPTRTKLLLLLLQTTNLSCRKQSFKDRLQKLGPR